MTKKNKAHTCSVCGAQMEHQACYACDGKGWVRFALVFKKDCEICGGSGSRWVCPDAAGHFRKLRENADKPVSRPGIAIVKPKAGRITLGTSQPRPGVFTVSTPTFKPPVKNPNVPPVPPPWHPAYPNPSHPMHPRSPLNPNNPNSPLNPNNPMNPWSTRNPNNPMNPMNPNNPINRRKR